jgi:hypothetical protein
MLCSRELRAPGARILIVRRFGAGLKIAVSRQPSAVRKNTKRKPRAITFGGKSPGSEAHELSFLMAEG